MNKSAFQINEEISKSVFCVRLKALGEGTIKIKALGWGSSQVWTCILGKCFTYGHYPS